VSQRVANCRRPNAASIPATTRMQRARQAKGRFSAVEVSRLVSARWRKYSAVQGGCGAPAAVAGARPRGGLARLGVRGWRFTARFSGLPSCLSLPSPPAARLESGSSAAPIISLSLEHLRENNCRGRHPATRKSESCSWCCRRPPGFKFLQRLSEYERHAGARGWRACLRRRSA